MTHTTSKHAFSITPESAEVRDGGAIVPAVVAGNFPGSPVTLRYDFTCDDSGIRALTVG
jgi:hypothetical protein